jgi:hypothetical protein
VNGPEELGRSEYFVPGSVLTVAVDPKNPLAHGARDHADVLFDESPVWRLQPGAGLANLRTVAWFDSAAPLKSGWAWGQHYLEDGIQMAEAAVGKGRVFLFAPAITFRTQPHGTFKYLFNALYLSVAPDMRAGIGE